MVHAAGPASTAKASVPSPTAWRCGAGCALPCIADVSWVMASTQMRRDVEGEEHGEPHDVDEMPVDGAERHGGVALWSEIAEQHPYQERQQDQEPDDHVGHVKPGNGEIKRAIRVRRDG